MFLHVLIGIFTAFLAVQPMVSVNAQGSEEMYATATQSLQRDGIVDPLALSSLRLGDTVNRAEALKVILKSQPSLLSGLAAVSSSMPPIPLFPDIDQRAWYAPFIELGYRQRLITGHADGFFRPSGQVKAEEAAVMIVRSYALDTSATTFASTESLPNIQGQWFTSSINVLHAQNAIAPSGNLRIGRPLTRGQLFGLVYRMRVAHGRTTGTLSPQPTAPSVPSSQIFVPEQDQGQSPPVQGVLDGQALQYASAKPFAVSIPSLGITDLTITHPEDAFTQDGVLSVLKDGVGHLFSYPGEGGKILVYGHSSGYPWDLSKYTKIFRGINKIAVGARIYVTYAGKLFVYQVNEKRTVAASDRSAFEAADNAEELILYTCWPPDSITQRYLVHAVPVETIALR